MTHRNSRVAEWILALFATREAASSIVGDLSETSRSVASFWLEVLRTAGRFLWREMTNKPGRLAVLGLRALLLQWVVTTACSILTSIVFWSALKLVPRFTFFGSSQWATYIGLAAGSFYVGRWIARRAPGREMAALVVMNVEITVLSSIALGAVIVFTKSGTWSMVSTFSLFSLLIYVPEFAGAALERRRTILNNCPHI